MISRRWKLLSGRETETLLAAAALAMLSACGGTNNLTLQNPAAPSSKTVAIAFQPAPAASISLAETASFAAVVSNDPDNLGVDWALLCSANANCGAISSQHSKSGDPITYTPPSTISGDQQSFSIEAFATADNTKNVVAKLAVTGFASALKGTYVFSTKGIDGNGPYQLAGVVTLDGNGGASGGEQTHNDPLRSISDAITGGSYSIGPDGRGSLTIDTADPNIGQQGVENFSLMVLSNNRALIANLDNPALSTLSYETSSGSLELQTSKAAPTAGYAFAVSGTGLFSNGALPMAMGGVLKIDSPGSISGAGSVADEFDGSNGIVNSNSAISGSVTNPDSFGAVKFTLTAPFSATTLQFTGYIVDAQHMKLIETDNTGSGTGGITSGIAIAQGAATGTFSTDQSFSGTYVLGILGQDFSGTPTSLALTGLVSADANGNLTSGSVDEVVLGAPKSISDSLTGSYTLDPSGTGRVDSQISFTKHETAPELIFYLTGNGNPPVVLSLDSTLGSLGIGLANPQTASAISFNGPYGLEFTQGISANVTENDSTAQITVNGSQGSLAGLLDSDVDFNGQLGSPLTGVFSPGSAAGSYSGSLTDPFFPTPGTVSNTIAVDFYLIDSTQGYFIETDSVTSAVLTFGNFSTRTPVCQSCQ